MNTILTERRAQRPGLALEAFTDFAEEAPDDGIPLRRRHFYVYTILLLLTLLIHTAKRSDDSSPAPRDAELKEEVTKFMKACDRARNLI